MKEGLRKSIFLIIFLIMSLIISIGIQDLINEKDNESKVSLPIIVEQQSPTFIWAYGHVPICEQSNEQLEPKLCTDGNGGVIITWYDNRSGTGYDVYCQRVNATGNVLWTKDGVAVGAATNWQYNPEICSDGNGGAIIAWVDYRNGENDIYAQKIDSNGVIQWEVNGVVICNYSNSQTFPEICSDGNGGAIITWFDYRNGIDGAIYAQRINATGNIVWTENGIVVCNINDDPWMPEFDNLIIKEDGNGGAIIAWVDNRSGTNWDIYAQKVNSSGAMKWGANGTLVCNANNDQKWPKMCSDGNSGIIITWEDHRNGSYSDIYAQRINSTGSTQWTNNGTIICNAINNQLIPNIDKDSSGGAFITWVDNRSSTDRDIYIQKVNSSGVIEWASEGVLLCNATDYQYWPKICTDGSDNAFVTWIDSRSGNIDIYSQKVNSTGDILWSVNGNPVTKNPVNQYSPDIIYDGIDGGIIITWHDYKSGKPDIFADKLNSTGSLKWNIDKSESIIAASDKNLLMPKICDGGNGTSIVIWGAERPFVKDDIFAQKIDSNGNCLWNSSGVLIASTNVQDTFEVCSDDAGGAIITWNGGPTGNVDIYAQRIDANGNLLWGSNGTIICNATDTQKHVTICSDGHGGAVIAWSDCRNGVLDANIYAQRVNSTGSILWTLNGVAISTASNYQYYPKLCLDGEDGVYIVWDDYRYSPDWTIFSQRVNSSGSPLWTPNGIKISTGTNDNDHCEICSDGNGGAIITWSQVFTSRCIVAQKINSSGSLLWGNYVLLGGLFASEDNPMICSDGNGGAIVVWETNQATTGIDLFTRRVLSNGTAIWDQYGYIIVDKPNSQNVFSVLSDGIGGAYIVWVDYRSEVDIYAQHINNECKITWDDSGIPICNYVLNQLNPSAICDGNGNMIIVWEDKRRGSSDIFGQSIKNMPPKSNHPNDINTIANGTETINWTITDDYNGGLYRVWANDTNDNYYIWINWTTWTNNTILNVSINRSAPGIYNYTIEFKDSFGYNGTPDTVIVNIKDSIPISNHPINFNTTAYGNETIQWILFDDYGTGSYRVWVNDTGNNYYIWVNWTPWANNTALNIPINRSSPGVFNYTIEYNDSINQFGYPDSVIVTILDSAPTSNHPIDFSTNANGAETIQWILFDDYGTGSYRVWVNDTSDNYYIWVNWTPWANNTALNVPINRSAPGIFNYTIEYNDSINQFGISDTVIITVIDNVPISDHPIDITTMIL
ncbi:MAG: hypothetical protein ACTSPY_15015 [Candidatus Helarchaeota archaeon]